MRRFAVRSIIGFGLMTLASFSPVLAASTSAPADEYFGRYHLSILGIRNAITDMTRKAHDNPEVAGSYLNSAELTEDAIRQWQSRYPQDSWLPKMMFSLERLYVTIGTPSSAERAVKTAAWLDNSFPQSEFAQMGHTELASLSTSDDGNASTPDSPAMLGMVPALTEQSDGPVPPSVDSRGEGATQVSAPNDLPSYAYRENPSELNGPRAVNIWIR